MNKPWIDDCVGAKQEAVYSHTCRGVMIQNEAVFEPHDLESPGSL